MESRHQKRMNFLRHLRLHPETSAKKPREARRNNKKPKGRPKETRLKNVQTQRDMDFKLTSEATETIAQDRTARKALVNGVYH